MKTTKGLDTARRVALALGVLMLVLTGFFPSSDALAVCGSAVWPLCFMFAICTAKSTKRSWLILPVFYVGIALRYLFTFGHEALLIMAMLLVSAGCAFLIFCAFFLYGIAYRKTRSPFATLLFPVLFTAVQIVFSQATHLGNIMNPYTVISCIDVLAQNAALIGELGLTFVLSWMCAAIIFVVIDLCVKGDDPDLGCVGSRSRAKSRVACISLSVICVLLVAVGVVFGSIRLSERTEKPDSIVVATLMQLEEDFMSSGGAYTEEDDLEAFEKGMASAVEQGADLVVTGEEYARFSVDTYDECMEEVGSIIRNAHIPTLFCVEKYYPDQESVLLDNIALLFDEDGNLLRTYAKHNLVPLLETTSVTEGDDVPGEAVVTIKGKPRNVAIAICFDLNDELFIDQMSDDVDIILAPSWDWDNVCYTQTRYTAIRAIERDATLVKATFCGYSYVADEYGIIEDQCSSIGKSNQALMLRAPVL